MANAIAVWRGKEVARASFSKSAWESQVPHSVNARANCSAAGLRSSLRRNPQTTREAQNGILGVLRVVSAPFSASRPGKLDNAPIRWLTVFEVKNPVN